MSYPNSVLPAAYGNPTMNPYYTPAQARQPQISGIIWVQGEEAAKSYMLVPNTTVALWDSEKQVIYWKSADASGMPSMKVLDYTVREPETSTPGMAEAGVSKDDFDSLKKEIAELKATIESLKPRKEE